MEKDSSKRRAPKRGAIPTPKEEIEKAPRYIPESDQASDQAKDKPASQPDSPTQTDEEQEGHEGS